MNYFYIYYFFEILMMSIFFIIILIALFDNTYVKNYFPNFTKDKILILIFFYFIINFGFAFFNLNIGNAIRHKSISHYVLFLFFPILVVYLKNLFTKSSINRFN